jgi:tetratricopeptide (TPR) repeat protein
LRKLLLWGWLCLACGAGTTPYLLERTRAERAYQQGDYAGAAQHWLTARSRAQNPHDRSEAEYRRAATLERAGKLDAAAQAYLEIERGAGERADRAAFARAELELDRGKLELGHELLRAALLRFPDSGLAARAAFRVLERVEETQGRAAAISEAERLARALSGTEVEDRLLFERAQRLERNDERRVALSAYLALAARFPYPHGAYWDDALLAAARLELGFGRPLRAIAELERLLRERESARISGSYERPSFAQARFRIAEIARDQLGDSRRARREFRRVWVEHPTSRLGDDALFEEALLALAAGDWNAACESAALFTEQVPESRYARCTRELCATAAPSTGRGCPGYAHERIRQAAAKPPAAPHSFSSSSSSSSSR